MLNFVAGGFKNLQLDIVGFLAILGESSVLANAQVSSLSDFFLLPRLLPAPQALIRIARPDRLAPSRGKIIGTHSGSICNHINHIANLLHNENALPAYSVRCQRITKVSSKSSSYKPFSEKDEDSSATQVKARALGPLSFLSVLGCSMSIALLVLSIVKEDGMALLATILLSTLSTLVGVGSRWSLQLKKRTAKRPVPQSDVVICYPHGAFHIIQCEEEVALQLYWHPEECKYHVKTTTYRILSLIATLLLMFGVIFLGNASLTLQTCYAAAYLILNAAYWTVAAFPQQWNWDLSCFHVETQHYADGEACGSYTGALWKAIATTQSTEWIKNGQIAPVNHAWELWLAKAGRMAGHKTEEGPSYAKDKDGRIVLPKWQFDEALTNFLNDYRADVIATNV